MEQASGGFASKIRGIIGIDFGTTQVSAVSVYGDGRPLSPGMFITFSLNR